MPNPSHSLPATATRTAWRARVWLSANCSLWLLLGISAAPADVVVGKIGAMEIKADELKATLGNLGDKEAAAVAANPSLMNQLVRSLLVQKLVLGKVRESKWDEQPEVKQQVQRVVESTLTESYLRGQSEPPATYPSEAELESYYQSNRASLLSPRQFRLAQIYVSLPKGADAAFKEKAETKLKAVKKALSVKSPDFKALASEFSDEKNSAGQGGEIGWVAESEIQPEIRSQLPTMTLGAISEPLKLDDGWHIIKVLDSKEPNTPTLGEVREKLRQQLRADKLAANTKEFLAQMLSDHPLVINEVTLAEELKKLGQ
jgi:parvulin-like peptidyl-prolyl isomerase